MAVGLKSPAGASPTKGSFVERVIAALASAEPESAARGFFYSAVFWLLVPGLAGLAMATLLAAPAAQELIPLELRGPLNFGRLRPLHVNVYVFGWLSMVYAGSMLFITSRVTGAPLYSEQLAKLTLVLWNVMILGAAVTLPLGVTQGREYAEMGWGLDLLFVACLLLLAVNIWGTVFRRKRPGVYVSVWNFMAASLIAPIVYAVGNKVWDPSGAYVGMTDAIMNYFYVHNIFNVWFTTGGIGLALYLLPKLTGNPLYSHRLAIWGFTSVWTGQHHLLYGPGPEWLEIVSVAFSILAAVPNTAFLINFLKTMEGSWGRVRTDFALRFLVVACFFYAFTCVQGIAQSFRTFSAFIHFTNWVVGHSHLAFVADYTFFAFALVYALLPRLLGRELASRRLMTWHFWLVTVGLVVFMVDLWIAGWVQALSWRAGAPFMDSVTAMQPFMIVRLIAGIVVGAGILAFVANVILTARGPRAAATPVGLMIGAS
ncbi:MAG: cbb3-type cytochrome c oxidase subunit I [Chloroflexi bacterium]|nr:cbb3-type cytochrome c oxidase subunit I [Chloroflexota bacterium]